RTDPERRLVELALQVAELPNGGFEERVFGGVEEDRPRCASQRWQGCLDALAGVEDRHGQRNRPREDHDGAHARAHGRDSRDVGYEAVDGWEGAVDDALHRSEEHTSE